MAEHKKVDFSGQRVVLDGNTYEGCSFKNAQMIYTGGAPPNLIRCDFDKGTFSFEGSAGRTLTFLQALGRDPALAGLIHQYFADALKRPE